MSSTLVINDKLLVFLKHITDKHFILIDLLKTDKNIYNYRVFKFLDTFKRLSSKSSLSSAIPCELIWIYFVFWRK